MNVLDLGKLSYRAIIINKTRSFLTMLGIVIGIMSVILMLGVGQAAQQYLLSQVASFGSDLVFVGNGRGDEKRGGAPSAEVKESLTERDFKDLKALSWTVAVDASVNTVDLLSYGGQDRFTQISGTTPDQAKIFNLAVSSGRFIESSDDDSRSRVIVIGKDVAKGVFGQEDPMGKEVHISHKSFRVIGVLAPAGTRFFSNVDDQVYIPYTAFFDSYNKNRVNFISVKAGDVRPDEAKNRIRIVLRSNHNIDNPTDDLTKDDFRVSSQEDTVKSADTIGTILQTLLGSIASISLLVAGVGIMNIMYVTVTERTREIGLRKAIGAKRRDILGQFLAEAVLLTVVAGAIGVLFGIGLSWLAIQLINSFQPGWVFAVPWNGVVLGFGVATLIGVIFGYFPARKAAQLSPIEALRYE